MSERGCLNAYAVSAQLLEKELDKANERIKDLECLQGEQLDRLAKENQELRLRLVPNGTETSAVLKATVARLEKALDRMTGRYIAECSYAFRQHSRAETAEEKADKFEQRLDNDRETFWQARKIIDNLK